MLDEGGQRVFGEVEAAVEAFEHLPFIVIVTDGPDLMTVAFNAAARALTRDRLIYGAPVREVFAREVMGQGWAEAYSIPTLTGETVTRHEHRLHLYQPDGSVTEIYLDAVFTPRHGPDGRPCGTILTARDVTERVLRRKATESELVQLRERLTVARGGVRAMQGALLAESVPVLPSFDIAARYVLASDEDAAGGDWFDAVAREDGSVVLVVGDVVGHGQAAAVAMGQLRTVLLAQLRAGNGLVEAMSFLDGFAATVPAARHATVCIVCIEESGDIQYAIAGHPPPLVLAADEAATGYLPPLGAGPLATGTEFSTGEAHLGVGDAIVLYSDGILERPGISPVASLVELRTTASNAQRNTVMPTGAPASAAERICTLTIELLTRVRGHTDDITILAAQRQPAVRDFAVELDVAPDTLQSARTALRAWLDELAPSADDVEALQHATTELVANAVEHAYLGVLAQPIRVTARLERDGRIVLQVVDRGSWKLPVITGLRGRGLALARQLVDELQIEQSGQGTTASIRHLINRPAGLLDGPASGIEPDPEHFDVWSEDSPEPAVTIIGPLDAANTAEAAAHLNLSLTEAAAVITVDLSRVTLLASNGVDLLFRVIEQAQALDLEMNLIAPNGSPAQHVLSLVRLPYKQSPPPS
jgi:serine phosphatase RsbU (regulator of sigma subunit)/anti-sigma regulatory factor (Ser/Thr protein kinase)/anti-anti-sigma regulatory factor